MRRAALTLDDFRLHVRLDVPSRVPEADSVTSADAGSDRYLSLRGFCAARSASAVGAVLAEDMTRIVFDWASIA